MIKQKGTAVFQNNIENDETTIKAIFPLTETDISYNILKSSHTGIKHTIIEKIQGYRVNLVSNIKLLFPAEYNTTTDSTLLQQLIYLTDILALKKEFYYMSYCVSSFGVYQITETDVEENRAYKIAVKETINIDNFVKHLELSGQEITINMESLNLVDITNFILQEGYGRGGYGEHPYGDPTT